MEQISSPFRAETTRPSPGEVRITLYGELDVAGAPRLRRLLADVIDDEAHRLDIDLQSLSFIDSTGLGALMGGFKRAKALGVDFALLNPSPSIATVFEITGVDRSLSGRG